MNKVFQHPHHCSLLCTEKRGKAITFLKKLDAVQEYRPRKQKKYEAVKLEAFKKAQQDNQKEDFKLVQQEEEVKLDDEHME